MKGLKYIGFILGVIASVTIWSQNPERKIIIEDGEYFYVTVDDNYQIGTLFRGSINRPITEGKSYALPAGRGMSAETNPLAWDVEDGSMYAISFLDHSLSDRNESIKKFSLSDLKQWGDEGVGIGEMIMESVDHHMYILNEPYLFIQSRSKYLHHFYFDAIYANGAYWMAIGNNDELTIWKCTDTGWEHSEVFEFPISGPFSLIENGEQLTLRTSDTELFNVGLEQVTSAELAKPGVFLKDIVLVENRDENKNYYIKSGLLNPQRSMKELLDEHGQLW